MIVTKSNLNDAHVKYTYELTNVQYAKFKCKRFLKWIESGRGPIQNLLRGKGKTQNWIKLKVVLIS